MKVTKSNIELVKRLKKGDMVAFDDIYNLYSHKLHEFVFMYLKQEEDAEEIVQDVFIKIWESRSKIYIYASFESFLFTIAYNATISLLRKRVSETKLKEYLKSLQLIDSTENVIDEIQFKDLNQKVQSLLEKLTPRQKEIQAKLKWFNKPAHRLPKASWFSFMPAIQQGNWILDKMGQPVNFRDVVKDGNRKLHAIQHDVRFESNSQKCFIESLDAPLVAPGKRNFLNFDNQLPNAKDGVHFCLHNNVWGTNFMMWFDEDMKYRFTMKI